MSRLWDCGDTDPASGATEPSAADAALQVRLSDALPSAIRWRGSWHQIERIALSWQLDVNWWRARIYRDYYKVIAGGMALVIYHDLLTDAWALQRVYD